MTYPRIKTHMIDSHDGTQPLKWRLVNIDGTAYFVARDLCPIYGHTADADGDYRSALTADGIQYKESLIDNLGEIVGPVTLISEADHKVLAAAAGRRISHKAA